MENRISVKHKNPNPLFEKWLIEWRDQAKEKNLKTHHAYSLALSSLRKYPLPLERGKDCKILKGFGNKLCDMLDEALVKYKRDDQCIDKHTINPAVSKISRESKNTRLTTDDSSDINNYIPSHRSGRYAILKALYENSSKTDNSGFLSKKELIIKAQPYCNTSFTKAEVGSFYTAWNSMRTLLNKKLVSKESNPAKFSLTTKGVILGCKLFDETNTKNYNSKTVGDTNEMCVLLSDSDDDNALPECSDSASKELTEICGKFMEDEEIVRDKVETFKNTKGMMRVCSSNTKSEEKIDDFEDFIMEPYSFDVLLFVDKAETSGHQIDPKDDAILSELQRLKVNYEVRNLKVGDYCWVCRHRQSRKELIAPYIIERKRMDDLASSIKDGRFHEQKFRIKQCGLKNVIYMVESYGSKDLHVGLPLNSLNQAIVNTLIQDEFTIKIVEGARGVAEYLSCMSNLLKNTFEKKTLASCPKDNISVSSITDDFMSLMYFTEFNKASTKTMNFMVNEMFVRQLLQIKGFSIEKARAIVDEYKTPKLLKNMMIENDRKSVNILSNIKYGKLGKKIGPLLSETLYMFYTKTSF